MCKFVFEGNKFFKESYHEFHLVIMETKNVQMQTSLTISAAFLLLFKRFQKAWTFANLVLWFFCIHHQNTEWTFQYPPMLWGLKSEHSRIYICGDKVISSVSTWFVEKIVSTSMIATSKLTSISCELSHFFKKIYFCIS